MGTAGRHGHVPTRSPQPPAAPEAIAVREATIPPGAEIVATWAHLERHRGVKVGIANVGSAPCAFDGREGEVVVVQPGKTVIVSLADGIEEFALRLRSTAGTHVRLAQGATPPRRILGTRKIIERDDKTQVIRSIMEIPVWVETAG
jgi:hypothetical protein